MVLDSKSKKIGLTLLFAAFVIATIAQGVLLFWTGMPLNTSLAYAGLGIYLLAGSVFILSLHSLRDVLPPLATTTVNYPGPRQKPRLLFWAISLSLSSVIAVYTMHAERGDARGYLFAALWILSISVAIFGVLREINWRPAPSKAIKHWLKAHRAELLVVILIILAAFFIRILDIELFPYSFNNDEGQMGSGGFCILQGGCKNFFVLGWAAQSELAYLAYAISIGIFGKTALAVRLVSVVTGTLSVLATYLLAREAFGKKVAWLAAVLLTTLPVHVHFSRMGVDNIIDSLTAPLMLWLLLRGVRRNNRVSFLAAGILAGLCFYTYPGSLLALALGVGALGLSALRIRGFLRAQASNLMAFVLIAVVIVTPLLGYYATHSDLFMARMKKEGILQNGNLQRMSQATGKNTAEIMLGQFSNSSLVYIAAGAPLQFFNSPKAYLPPFEAVIFMFGMAYLLWRIKDFRCRLILIWFWTVVIFGSTLTNYPPASQRLLMSMPALIIMTALGLSKILGAFSTFGKAAARWMPVLLLSVILLIGYININYYFYTYRIGHYYEDRRDELTYETRIYTEPLHQQGRVFLLANPKALYLSYKSFDFFAPDVEKVELNDVTRQTLLDLPDNKDALFIALPGYEDELKQIADTIPGGEWRQINRRYQPQYTLFYSYKISRVRLAIFVRFSNGYEHFKVLP